MGSTRRLWCGACPSDALSGRQNGMLTRAARTQIFDKYDLLGSKAIVRSILGEDELWRASEMSAAGAEAGEKMKKRKKGKRT